MSAHHTATRGSFHRVNLTMSSPRCRPSMAPYDPGDRVQAHRVAPRLTAYHCPPLFCIPATWNSFTSSHPTLSCLQATPHPVTLVSLLYLEDSSSSSAPGVDISSSRKPSLTPRTCEAPPSPALLPCTVMVCFLVCPPNREVPRQEPG